MKFCKIFHMIANNRTSLYNLSLVEFQDIVTLGGYNYYNWYKALRLLLKDKKKLYIRKDPILEEHLLISQSDHNACLKYCCDVIDVCYIILE